MRQNLRMRPEAKPPGVQDVVYWRELLFWLLLLSAFSALGSDKPTREFAGLIEAAAFFLVAVSSAGRLKTLGLEFIAWERISLKAIGVCVVYGLVAGAPVSFRNSQSIFCSLKRRSPGMHYLSEGAFDA